MDAQPNGQELSKYNRYILNRIIPGFEADKDFNIYQLVKESVSYKCILPSENEIVMDTYYTIKEYLLAHDFIVERKDMIAYCLTGKGMALKSGGSLEKFETNTARKHKRSLLHSLFFKGKKNGNNPGNNPIDKLAIEFYE